MKRFRAFTDHDIVLSKYATAAYIECKGDMIKLMTNRGIEAAVLVLTEAKSCGPLHPLFRPPEWSFLMVA